MYRVWHTLWSLTCFFFSFRNCSMPANDKHHTNHKNEGRELYENAQMQYVRNSKQFHQVNVTPLHEIQLF